MHIFHNRLLNLKMIDLLNLKFVCSTYDPAKRTTLTRADFGSNEKSVNISARNGNFFLVIF